MAAMTTPNPDLDERRRRVVEVAAQVLAADGPHGLSLRRIATLAGGSTQMVYTLFGGKPGLGDALYQEGFRRLGETMRAAAEASAIGDPERLVALGRGYRAFALAEPDFFSVMFGRAIPGFSPTRPVRSAMRSQTFGQVVTAAQGCLDAGTMHADDALTLARACWVTAHGLAALETAGLLAVQDTDVFAETVLRGPVDGYRPR
jgi:AcrR family transcriptional regulator